MPHATWTRPCRRGTASPAHPLTSCLWDIAMRPSKGNETAQTPGKSAENSLQMAPEPWRLWPAHAGWWLAASRRFAPACGLAGLSR